MDRAFAARSLDAVLDLFEDDYEEIPEGWGKGFIRNVTSHRFRDAGPSTFETALLGGTRHGDLILILVEHRSVYRGREEQIRKLSVLRQTKGVYRIALSADAPREAAFEISPGEIRLESLGVRFQAPPGWILIRGDRDMLLEPIYLVSPRLDAWIGVGLLDTGGKESRALARKEIELFRMWRPDLEVREEGETKAGELPGYRTRVRLPGKGDRGDRLRDRTYFERAGVACVVLCESDAKTAPNPCEEPLRGLLGSIRTSPLTPDSGDRFVRKHGTGRASGRRYSCDDPPVEFTAPASWSLQIRGSTLPYLVGMRAPGGKREIVAGAFPLWGDPEKFVRGLVRTGTMTEPVLEPIEAGGRKGWRVLQEGEEGTRLVAYMPAGGVLHFFSVEPGGPGAPEILERFLAGVRFPEAPAGGIKRRCER